jgi:hypothetical protein
VGTEELLVSIASEPAWVMDIYKTNAVLALANCETTVDGGFECDGYFLVCDLGHRNGTFFSPHRFEKQLHPTFRSLFRYLRDK